MVSYEPGATREKKECREKNKKLDKHDDGHVPACIKGT